MRSTENVMEACARTETVRNCVLTSSLLACIWRDQPESTGTSRVVDHGCWSSFQLCQDKKVAPFLSPWSTIMNLITVESFRIEIRWSSNKPVDDYAAMVCIGEAKI